MKTLNENWFAFTLIAVVFGILGFLLGKQGSCHKGVWYGHHAKGMAKAHYFIDDHNADISIDIDTLDGHEKQIKVIKKKRVKK